MEILFQISKVILLFFLCAAAVMDVRTRELPLLFLLVGGLGALGLQLISGGSTIVQMLLGCIPGAGLLLVARITRQAVGYGDGAVLFVSGLILGLFPTVLLLLCALLITAFTGIVLMIFKKWKQKRTLPFVPYIYFSYILLLLIE